MLLAARDHRRVAVRSGHSIGKTTGAACLILWWLYARKGLVVTTAPTWEHVEDVLWREVHLRRDNALVYLPGKGHNTELNIDKTWYAVGLSTSKSSAFQGRHHPRLLVVIDEAPGVSEQVHLEISTLATGDQNVIFMVGNPTDTHGTFYDAFKHPDIWHCIKISCYDHPNVVHNREIIPGAVTTTWIEDRAQTWGKNHPFWYSRVLGEFPRISNRGVIPLGWVERSIDEKERLIALKEAIEARYPRVGGLDVARYGDNKTVFTIRRGDAIEKQIAWGGSSISETTGRAVRIIKEFDVSLLVVDAAGIGGGVADLLIDDGFNILAYNGGHRAFTPTSFSNRRSEMWWYLRQRFEKKRIWLPQGCEELVADLVAPEYELSSSGRIKLWSKEKMLDTGIASPDFADSLVLSYAMDEDPEKELMKGPKEHVQDSLAYEEEFVVIEDIVEEFHQFPGGAF